MKSRDREKPVYAPPKNPGAFSGGLVAAYGVGLGWLALRLLNLSQRMTFQLVKPPEGIRNFCYDIGYPKQQDYFWYIAVLLSAWGGAALMLGLRQVMHRAGWKGAWSWWPGMAGIGLLTSGMLLAIPWQATAPALGILCAGLGLILPWFDTRWMTIMEKPVVEEPDFIPTLPESVKWIILSLLMAAFVGFDTCIEWRNIDGIHEGAHLAYVQSWLSGDKPGITVWPEYAPLYVYSLIGWMKVVGMTIYSERWYFQAVQILGTALHITALRWVCRTRVGAFIGFWTMLTMTLAGYVLYGASNSMRTAIAFAALIACWRGLETTSRKTLVFSGVLFGVAMLYSQEYALTCLLPCLLIFGATALRRGFRGMIKEGMAWAGSIGATMAVILLAIYGKDVVEATVRLFGGGYASSRLSGHGAHPFPLFPRISGFADLAPNIWNLFENFALWWPAFAAGAAGAWLLVSGRAVLGGRRLLALALLISGLVMQVPAIIRPMGHLTTAGIMIPMLGLATLVIDWMWGRRGAMRKWAGIIACVVAIFGLMRLFTLHTEFERKWGCMYAGPDTHHRPLDRLGKVRVVKIQEDATAFVVGKIREMCPPDRRIYISAPSMNHLLFLADRAGLPPYPTTTVAASTSEREIILESLEKYKPPLAIITDQGVDLQFAEEHKAEWAYINKHYRQYAQADVVKFYRRVK